MTSVQLIHKATDRPAWTRAAAPVALGLAMLMVARLAGASQSPSGCSVNNLQADLAFPPADSNVECGTMVPFTATVTNGTSAGACDVTNADVTFNCPDPATGTPTGPMTTLDTNATFTAVPPSSTTYPPQNCTIGVVSGNDCTCAAVYRARVEVDGTLHDNPTADDSVNIAKTVSINCFTTTTTTLPRCGNGVVDPGEQCDPPGSISCPAGSPANAFLACSANCTCPTGDHYICYNSTTSEANPPDVNLDDQFETGKVFHPKRCHPKSFCAPASKNMGPVSDPT